MFSLGPVETLAAAALTLIFGQFLVRRIRWAERYNLPAPVVGGLIVALAMWGLRQGDTPAINFDKVFQSPLMVAFFAAMGYSASLETLRKSGRLVALYLAACTVVLVFQNFLGIGIAKAFGLSPLFGILTGSVSLAGGPGTALAFADSFEKAGVEGAAVLGLAAAMGGILMGGMVGGPVGTRLIRDLKLKPSGKTTIAAATPTHPEPGIDAGQFPIEKATMLEGGLFRHGVALLLMMWVGSYISLGLQKLGVTLPSYVGAMFLASVARNVDDKTGRLRLDPAWFEALGGFALSLFLAMSMMTLALWRLAAAAVPLLVVLVAQAVFAVILSTTIMFRLSGRDYDAAVMAGGFLGFMLGTTANAMANMDALTKRYGPAPRAYVVVPLVGACFIDFTNALMTSIMMNFFK